MQIEPGLRQWLLKNDRPDPDGLIAARRQRLIADLEADRLAEDIRLLGGPGSGNFGHGGRPGEVGGSVVFHGTIDTKLDSIKKEGISRKFAGAVWPDLSQPDRVYITTDLERAQSWARETADKAYTDVATKGAVVPVVLQVRIPETEAKRLFVDENFFDDSEIFAKTPNREFAGDIKPEWIEGIWKSTDKYVQDTDGFITHVGKGTWTRVLAASEGRVFYVPFALIVDEDMRAAGGPGSGNFGHEGRPGEIGGSGPGGGAHLFHATLESNIQSILKEGISRKYAGAMWPAFSKRDSVYATTDKGSAQRWALETASMLGQKAVAEHGEAVPVVIEVEVPLDELDKLSQDSNFHSREPNPDFHPDFPPTEREFKGDIPPSWIKAVWKSPNVFVKGEYGLTFKNLPKQAPWQRVLADRGTITLYIPLALLVKDRVPRAAGGPGSGNFGHAGRPGEVGGSLSDDHGQESSTVSAARANIKKLVGTKASLDILKKLSTDDLQKLQRNYEVVAGHADSAAGRLSASATMRAIDNELTTRANVTIKTSDTNVVADEFGQPEQQFKFQMDQRGYKTLGAREWPEKFNREFPLAVPAQPLSKQQVEGFDLAMRHIQENAPALHQYVKDHVSFIHADHDPPQAAATTVLSKGNQQYIIINGRTHTFENPRDPEFNVPLQQVKGLTGDERLTATYKGIIIHELGHVADNMTNESLRTLTSISVVASRPTQAEALELLNTSVSHYARQGGPSEAAAEIFAATILGKKLPNEYAMVQEQIEHIIGKKLKAAGEPVELDAATRDWLMTTDRPDPDGVDAEAQARIIAKLEALDANELSGAMTETAKKIKALGGPGSGNFGHAGRPGEVGGSASDEGGGSRDTTSDSVMTEWKSEGGWEHTGIHWDQPTDPKTGRPIPLKVHDVSLAALLVLNGKVVEVPDVKTAHTLIEKLADMAREAKAAGKEAKEYNLCDVAVAGTNMFCAEILRNVDVGDKHYGSEGIDRLEMPQLGGKPVPGSEADKLPRTPWNPNEVDGASHFKSYLQGIGIKTESDRVSAASLKATQNEMKGVAVASIMNDKTFDPAKNPVFISSDNYVVDGHHRWAAVVGRDAEDGILGDSQINVTRVNAPISEVLHLANAWATKFGIAQNAGVQKQDAKSGLRKKAA